MKVIRAKQGFTLIELLLVVVIIGLMLAVIVPRAWRANIDTKYGLVRQAASELAAFGQEWAEQMVYAQPESDSTTTCLYYLSLAGFDDGAWIPDEEANWVGINSIDGRTPEASVQGIVTPEKTPRPFQSVS